MSKIKQTILDTLIMVLVVIGFGALAWWMTWDEPIHYRIQTPKPFSQPRFIKVWK
jgi:hypothetical protein